MSYISFYKIIFIIELLIAEYLFAHNLKKRNKFYLRLILGLVVLFGISFIPLSTENFILNSLDFFVLFWFSLFLVWLCYEESFFNILFCCMAGYTTQHFAYEITNLMLCLVEQGISPLLGMYSNSIIDFSSFDKRTLFSITLYLICYFISYWIIYLLFAKRIKKGIDLKINNLILLGLIFAGAFCNIIIGSMIIHYMSKDFIGMVINFITNGLCCILLLVCQFNQLTTKETKRELDILQMMWIQEKQHYQLLQENIDLINIKCHDMKHKIRLLTNGKNFSNEEIESIDKSITIYDSSLKTGNEALDVILTEKAFICNEKNVKFTCVIDGTLISFINETDIFSLFGNIMDNALNATLKMDNIDERFINLKINKEKDFISINIKNSFKGKINLDKDGLPITDNVDKNYHGFGMKSISYMVEKYHGNLSIAINDNIFNLNILFLNKTA